MRHRIATGFGLGNPSKELLPNNGELPKRFIDAATYSFFPEGFDFKIESDQIAVGIEPAYQYDRLRIIAINRDKEKSYIQLGKAWGPYGSGIAKTTRTYGDYKNRSKFIRFVDIWHSFLFYSAVKD